MSSLPDDFPMVPCPDCDPDTRDDCDTCDGKGTVPDYDNHSVCDRCEGSGVVNTGRMHERGRDPQHDEDCRECGGKGWM